MKVDLSRYSECPNCHTFQASLLPCRKCGWHVVYKEFTHEPGYKSIHETVSKPGPKPKAGYLSKELAMLRRLEDGQWHSMVELRRTCMIDRWEPKHFLWQGILEASGIIGYDTASFVLRIHALKFLRGFAKVCYGISHVLLPP